MNPRPTMSMLGAVLALQAFPPTRAQSDRVTVRIDTRAYKGPRVGRNELCPCESGRKYKRCCAR
jgi:uncharacterized protein YecA (UPF0149 family)